MIVRRRPLDHRGGNEGRCREEAVDKDEPHFLSIQREARASNKRTRKGRKSREKGVMEIALCILSGPKYLTVPTSELYEVL